MMVKNPSRAELIKEYSATQEMIKHFDQLRWYAGFVIFGGIAAVVGLAFRAPRPENWYPLLFFFSFFALVPWYYWYVKIRTWIVQKYRRLREIEDILGFYQQHTYCQQQDGKTKLLRLPADVFPGSLACAIPSIFLVLWLKWFSPLGFMLIIIIFVLVCVFYCKLRKIEDFRQAITEIFPKLGLEKRANESEE